MPAPTPPLEHILTLLASHPSNLIPLSLAKEWAGELGLCHRLLCSVALEPRGVVCILTTADETSVLEAVLPDGRRAELRSRRQVGAETWEYTVPLEWPADTYRLELRRGDETRILPLAPTLLAILEAHGWGDPIGRVAEGCVRRRELRAAVTELLASAGSADGLARSDQ